MSSTEQGNLVEACSWDITGGAVGNIVGRMFLRTTSTSSEAMPESIDHVGIIVYGRLYEYGYRGILKSNVPRDGEDPVPQYMGCKLRNRQILGRTMKPRSEFVEWLINSKYGKFRGSNYDVVTHNCLDFCKVLTQFLGVPSSPNWDKVCNWVRSNQRLTDYIARGLGQPTTSTSTTSNSNRRAISLQEAEYPPDPPPQLPRGRGRPNNSQREQPQDSRRRFSVTSFLSRSGRLGRTRSASMETLPPSYEEAIRMRQEETTPAPKYEDLVPVSQPSNN